MVGRTKALVAALAAGLALVATAAAATAVSPDASKMTLQAADLPASTQLVHKSVTLFGFPGYERGFELKAPYSRSAIIEIDSVGLLGDSAARAASTVATLQRVFRTSSSRKALQAAFAKSAKVKPTDVTLSAARAAHVGDHATELPIKIRVKGGYVYESILYMSLDRVVVELVVAGVRPVAAADSVNLARLMTRHITKELTPANLAVPAVSGNDVQGQVLTATSGTWTNTSPTFTYQWQRCDATGANCADIAGATAQTYTLDVPDVNSTLRVTVTATNRFGAPTAQSVVTPVVTAPPPPPPPSG
jgi:hypothetical protein